MFNKQIDYYKRKIQEVKGKVSSKNLELIAKSIGFDYENLENEFKENSIAFKKFAYSVTKTLSTDGIKSEILPEDHPKYKDEVKKVEDLKAEGKEHPCVATHTYVEINDKTYELFNNTFSGIGHIDVVEL